MKVPDVFMNLYYFFDLSGLLLNFPLQVLLTPGHQPSGLRRLRADGDRVEYLPRGGAAPRLFHHSAKTGLDYHGEGQIVFRMWLILCSVCNMEVNVQTCKKMI